MTTVSPTTHPATPLNARRKFGQIAGLAVGFVLGQGLTFLTQTYLLSGGHAVLLGEFAVGLGVVTLCQWFADMGGMNLMSGKHNEHRFVASVLATRLLMSFLIVLAVPYCTTWITTPFARGIVDAGRFVAIVWALNLTGLLDGARRSGQSGLVSFGPWLGCNLATLWIAPTMSYATGQIVGLGFAIGAILTVAMQYLIARDLIKPVRPDPATMLGYLRHGITCALTYATALTYSRLLLFLVYLTCTPVTTGTFAFIRSLISSLQQGLSFVRRVEYPDLVSSNVDGLRKTLRLQATSIALSGLVAVGMLAIYPIAVGWVPSDLRETLWMSVIFVGTIPVWCVASALGQQFLAKHKTQVNLMVMVLGTVISLTITYLLLDRWGIVAIAAAEVIMFVFMFWAYFVAYRRVFA